MAMLWFLSCLALLSEVYGQSCREKFLDPNTRHAVDTPYVVKVLPNSDMNVIKKKTVDEFLGYFDPREAIVDKDKNGLWIEPNSDMNVIKKKTVDEFLGYFDPREAIIDKDENGFWIDASKTKRRRSITSPQEESPVSLASSSDVFNNGDTCVTANVTYTCDSTNNQQGADQKSTEDTSGNSQRVTVPILTDDECQKHWGTKSQKNEICTGLSSCMVDSGAGLLCKRNGTWIMAGIASSSCSKSKPAMFTHMSAFKG